MPTKEVKQIKGIKLRYLSQKENEYGTNHLYQVLDETPFKQIIELGKNMKMPIWEYNNKLYLKITDVKVKEVADMLRKHALQIGTCF